MVMLLLLLARRTLIHQSVDPTNGRGWAGRATGLVLDSRRGGHNIAETVSLVAIKVEQLEEFLYLHLVSVLLLFQRLCPLHELAIALLLALPEPGRCACVAFTLDAGLDRRLLPINRNMHLLAARPKPKEITIGRGME
jgi:hypothetical protein